MAVFPFTVRATDSEGSYADRQFNITVRNSRVERFMVIDSTNAWTSPDGTSWTQRSQAGGLTCAYGNGFWMVYQGNGTNWPGVLKSTDGINYVSIPVANQIFLDDNGTVIATGATSLGTDGPRMSTNFRIKFFAGKFWAPCFSPTNKAFEMWSSVDGITWQRKTLYKTTIAGISNGGQQQFFYNEDNGNLFIPFVITGNPDTAFGSSFGYGWMFDGTTWTFLKNINQVTTSVTNVRMLGRINGVYFAFMYNYNGSTISNTGTYHYSTDGVNWTTTGFIGSRGLTSSYFGGGQGNTGFTPTSFYYANGVICLYSSRYKNYNSTTPELCMQTTDGITWVEVPFKMMNGSTTGTYSVTGMYKNGVHLVWANQGAGGDVTTDLNAANNGFRLSLDGTNFSSVNVVGTGAIGYNDAAAMS